MHERFQTDIINGKVYTLDEELLLTEHKEMAIGLGEGAGRFRSVNVYVKGSSHKFAPYDTIRSKLASVLMIFYSKITSANSLEERIKAAIYIHYEIVNIHPFRDYNGRMARYIMNLVLFQYCRIPPVSILPGIKDEYFASVREVDKNNDYRFITTIITESIIRSIEKAFYYTHIQDGMGLLLNRFTLDQLAEYCKSNNITTDESSKSKMIRDILRLSNRIGEFAFVLELEKQDLQSIVLDNNLSTFSQLQTCLIEILFSNPNTNLKQFLNLFNTEGLDRFLELLRMKDESSKEGKITAIMEEVLILGMRIGFGNMKEENISSLCNELKISSFGSKLENIHSMFGVIYPHYSRFKHLLFKEYIWDIKKGISLEQLYQFHYYDLLVYAKKQQLNLKHKSKKSICKNILTSGHIKRLNENDDLLQNLKKKKL
ncbi:predicted protein [Naegleria gruberi]|uniref:Predicted protein n=1 Tax=Naegleria gruberi TaxID=5762 RepID=D2VGI1_NAEGR|nr:uncharacterized protein NAEGRDRAFT_67987 [Naegleria gruberi]EFC43969.1 predicted protein [Naegleria gruberi]|eukprot:XP_002676713.1 predicted protein [Naegleria gruberi strain NEG-M]